ncbi:MAG: hypothetical protein ACT4PE_15040 [Candidatus Eiseniibacteriota bacterium]
MSHREMRRRSGTQGGRKDGARVPANTARRVPADTRTCYAGASAVLTFAVLSRLVALAASALAVSAGARTWDVHPDGSGAAPTIAAALDSTAAGDTVLLACGTYFEHSLLLPADVVLRSETGTADCAVIDALQLGRCVTVSAGGPATRIEGVTFVNGRAAGGCADPGLGTYCMGGGLLCIGSSPSIVACAFRDSFASDNGGGASCLFSSPTFTGCEFTGNAAHVGGGLLSAFPFGAPVLDGCLFAGNSAVTDGGALYVFGTSLTISGCTIAGNTAGQSGGGIFWISEAALAVDRTVIALNAGASAIECGFGASVPALICSNVWGNGGGDWTGCTASQLGTSGNLSLDPLFCDASAGVYTLSASSPCAPGASCGGIGALDVVCGALGVEAVVSPESWGRVKASWR